MIKPFHKLFNGGEGSGIAGHVTESHAKAKAIATQHGGYWFPSQRGTSGNAIIHPDKMKAFRIAMKPLGLGDHGTGGMQAARNDGMVQRFFYNRKENLMNGGPGSGPHAGLIDKANAASKLAEKSKDKRSHFAASSLHRTAQMAMAKSDAPSSQWGDMAYHRRMMEYHWSKANGGSGAMANSGTSDGVRKAWQFRKGNQAIGQLFGSPQRQTFEDVSKAAEVASVKANTSGMRDDHLKAQTAHIAAQRYAERGGLATYQKAALHAQRAEAHLKSAMAAAK